MEQIFPDREEEIDDPSSKYDGHENDNVIEEMRWIITLQQYFLVSKRAKCSGKVSLQDLISWERKRT